MMRARAIQTAGAAVIALACVATAFAPKPARAAGASPRSAADCRAITDFDLRGKCWDALDQATQKDVKDVQVEKKKNFGLGLHPPSIAAVLPKKEVTKARVRKAESEDVRNLILTIAEVDDSRQGHLLLTSTDGAIWEQTDGDQVNGVVEPGATVKVSKASLGSYMCQVTRWQQVRCQRDK